MSAVHKRTATGGTSQEIMTYELNTAFEKDDRLLEPRAYRQSVWQKCAANTIKPMQTRIYRKKYVNGSVNSEGHTNKLKTRRDAYLGLYLPFVIKSPIQLVRQSL